VIRHAKAPSANTAARMGTTRARRAVFGLVCLCVLGLAAFLGSGAPTAAADEACPNEARRAEQHSTALPDCRAYEMVSPPDKEGGKVQIFSQRTHASAECIADCAVGFTSLTGFADAAGSAVDSEYMAVRDPAAGGNGWVTHGITPPLDPLTFPQLLNGGESFYEEFSSDLSAGVFRTLTPLTDAPNVDGSMKLYTREDLRLAGHGNYRLETDTATPQDPWNPQNSLLPAAAGHSADFRHVLFETDLDVTGVGSGPTRVYESDEGTPRLIGLVPSGADTECDGAAPPCILPPEFEGSSIAGLGASVGNVVSRAISADGSRVNFSAPANEEGFISRNGSESELTQLYQRDSHGTPATADDTTIKLSQSERDVPSGAQAAVYDTASTDGSRVFFTTRSGLTDQVTPGVVGLYMYDFNHANDEVQKLTVKATSGQFRLILSGEETSDLPFNASTEEVSQAIESLSAVAGAGGQISVTGGPGDEAGSSPYMITFQGGLAATDEPTMSTVAGSTPLSGGAATATVVPWLKGGGHLTALSFDREPAIGKNESVKGVIGASEDGSYVYFVAGKSSGEHQLVAGGPPVSEEFWGLYLWHEGQLSFLGSVDQGSLNYLEGFSEGGYLWGFGMRAARVTPDGRHLLFQAKQGGGLTGYDHGENCEGKGTPCDEFYTYDADTEALQCVSCNPSGATATANALGGVKQGAGATLNSSYESRSISADGRYVFFSTAEALVSEDTNGVVDAYEYDTTTEEAHLLSSGHDEAGSYFLDASADGNDVFFVTREHLSGWDVDQSYDLYDARIGGGIPEPPPRLAACEGESCRSGSPSPPAAPSTGSASVNGPGNLSGRQRCPKGRRAVRRHGKTHCIKKHAGKHHRKRNRGRTNTNRRVGR
jgi:hypothetical protein